MNQKTKAKVEHGINELFAIDEGICLVALFFMVCTVTAQVIARLFNGNIFWCEEVMLILMDLLLFLLLPIGIKEDLLISVEVFAKHFPRRIKVFLVYFSDVVLLMVAICMVVYGRKLIEVKSTFPQTGLPRKYLYYITIISGILCIIVLAAKFFGLFKTNVEKEFLDGEAITQENKEKEASK